MLRNFIWHFYPVSPWFVCHIDTIVHKDYLFSSWILLRYPWHGSCVVQILSNQSQSHSFSQWSHSQSIPLKYEVPQGPVLGPVLCVLYTSLCQLSLITTLCCMKVLQMIYSYRRQVKCQISNKNDRLYSWLHFRSKILDDPKQTPVQWRWNRGSACHSI